MPNENEILRLETKLQDYQKKEKNWEKEQNDLILLSKQQKKEITKLNNDLNNLTSLANKENKELLKKLNQKDQKLEHQTQQLKTQKDLNLNLVNKFSDLEQQNLKLVKELNKNEEKLSAEQQKNELLEEKISDLEITIENQNNQISEINLELKNTRENNRFLNDLWNKIEGKEKDTKWYSNRDTFIQILKDNFSDEEIKKNFGNVYDGWLGDTSFEILTKKDKQKLNNYEKLKLQSLPEDWQNQINSLKEWNNNFKNLTPKEVKKNIQNYQELCLKLVERIWNHVNQKVGGKLAKEKQIII